MKFRELVERDSLELMPVVPIPKELELSAAIPLHVLPPMPVKLINAVATAFGVSPDLAVPPLLASVFAAAQGNFIIQIRDDWPEILTEYLIESAPPSSLKSPIVAVFIEPLARYEAELQRAGSGDGHEILKEFVDCVAADMKKQLKKRFSQLYVEHGDLETVQSAMKSDFAVLKGVRQFGKRKGKQLLLMSKSTIESLAEQMDNNGQFMAMFETEGGFLKTLRPEFDELARLAYVGEPYKYHTKTSGNSVMAAPVMTICCVSHQRVMRSIYENKALIDNGFAARFLPLIAPSTRGASAGSPPAIPKDLLAWFDNHIQTLLRIPPREGAEDERLFHVLGVTPAAKARLEQYEGEVKRVDRDGMPEGFEYFLGKLHGHAARLSGAVHLLKHRDPQNHEIDDDSALAGIALARVFCKHAEVAHSPDAREGIVFANKILTWMKRHRPLQFKDRDAQLGVSHCLVPQIRAGVEVLERLNYVRRHIYNGSSICVVNVPQLW